MNDRLEELYAAYDNLAVLAGSASADSENVAPILWVLNSQFRLLLDGAKIVHQVSTNTVPQGS